MKWFLAICLAVTTVLVIHVQWTDATFFDDFVKFPSLKVKRDLEMEEFFKDGDKNEAKKRALNRQRRSNDENMSEGMERLRRSLDDDDEEGEFDCRAHEMDNMKRSARDRRATGPVKWKKDLTYPCTDLTMGRVNLYMEYLTIEFNCEFDPTPVTEGFNIDIACQAGKGNFAPIGAPGVDGTNKRLNLEQPGGKAAYKKTIYHELLHVCGLYHTQQEPMVNNFLKIDFNCIASGYASQYTTKTNIPYEVDPSGYDSTVLSIMEYPSNAFLAEGCVTNIESTSPTSLPTSIYATMKEPYFHEMKKLRKEKHIDCNEVLKNDEAFSAACEILSFHPTPNVQFRELKIAEEWFHSESILTCAGEANAVHCNAANFQIVGKKWYDIPYSPWCRKGAGRIFGLLPDTIYVRAFSCYTTETMDFDVKDVDKDELIYLDMSSVSAGCMEVEFFCNN